MTDPFKNYPSNLESPAADFYAISKSDTVNETLAFRAIYVGGDGNIAVVPLDGGTAVVFTGLTAGTILPVRGIRVDSTDTTATAMVGLV